MVMGFGSCPFECGTRTNSESAHDLDFPGAAVDDLGKRDYAALLSGRPTGSLRATPPPRLLHHFLGRALLVLHLPRLRALALLRRRPSAREESPTSRRPRNLHKTDNSDWLHSLRLDDVDRRMIIPLVNVIALYVLAFSSWPALSRRGQE